MKLQLKISLRTVRAMEMTVLLGLFAFAICGVMGAWR